MVVVWDGWSSVGGAGMRASRCLRCGDAGDEGTWREGHGLRALRFLGGGSSCHFQLCPASRTRERSTRPACSVTVELVSNFAVIRNAASESNMVPNRAGEMRTIEDPSCSCASSENFRVNITPRIVYTYGVNLGPSSGCRSQQPIGMGSRLVPVQLMGFVMEFSSGRG